jgi:methylated-DNA-[protein]-cysteine S-methyltransferase
MKILEGTYTFELPFHLWLNIEATKGLVTRSWFSEKIGEFFPLYDGPAKEFLQLYCNGVWEPDLISRFVSFDGMNYKRVLVYRKLCEVGIGMTITYGQLGSLCGCSPREVGTYMRTNKFPLFIPCHRVTGKNSLGGFTPNVEWKRRILDWEAEECKRL